MPLRCVFALMLAACAGVLLTGTSVSASDWPQWRGPNRDGIAADSNFNADWRRQKPELLWMVDGMGQGYASVSVVDGKLFTTGNDRSSQSVVCADAATGELQWRRKLTDKAPKHGYEGSRCTPTVDGDRLYVVTSNGQISCLRTADGEVVWTRSFDDWNGKMMSGWGFSESPLVDGNWVLCTPGGPDAMIVALNKMTGDEVWASAVPQIGENGKDGAAYSSIVISEGAGVKQYVQLVGRGVIGVRAEDGKFLWGYNRVANGTANIPTPIIEGDYVFASTGYGTGSCLLKLSRDGNGVKAEEQYFLGSKTFQNHHGGMILVGDHVYAGHQHNKGFPICVEMKSGDVTWFEQSREFNHGSAAITYVDGHIIFRYQDGFIALIEATPEGFKLDGMFKPVYQEGKSWSHPVVVDGKMYLREQDRLMCYDVSET
ncbi:outer membrane biogenesis protein BamB [Maioricimonas rarisocia]|uniref:Outer membrane biogenesis protein BamB n=1 Tax=Maioricimonas rarisocia TaxID=2528026 RepID=A0A517ZDK3_9PLAN|nr:PQQ-binding-like beta-propeller repeat protein [Maioricimonas rarisocia]QDU40557.1 outer membrane biogenesis protein BamB [Maioricimonas rarisocia]